jgi:predicted phage terminase large subunit-like protein
MKKETDAWEAVLKFLEPKRSEYWRNEPTIKQKAFLRSEALEVLFGGQASGGKSEALLMGALQWADTPGYAAFIFRNTYSDLSLPGALMDRSHDWLDDADAVWKEKNHQWVFPSGATLTFGYLEKPNDHLRYKGMEAQYIGMDEVTEIREKHYRYLFSRLRKPSGKNGLALARVPLRMRAASNPAPNWVRRRFIEEGDKHGRIFIPSGIKDNPFVDETSYRQALAQLDEVERARLENGDWYAEGEGTKLRREYFKFMSLHDVPLEAKATAVRYWDIASTVPNESNPNPDWTVGVKAGMHNGILYILDVRRDRLDPAGVEALIRQTAEEDSISTRIRMETQPGAAGRNTIDNYSRFVLNGFDFDGHPTITKKEERLNLWAGKAKRGEVILVSGGDWINALLDELVAFPYGSHDDQADAVSGAYEVLSGVGQKIRRKGRIII